MLNPTCERVSLAGLAMGSVGVTEMREGSVEVESEASEVVEGDVPTIELTRD